METTPLRGEVAYVEAFFLQHDLKLFKLFLRFVGIELRQVDRSGCLFLPYDGFIPFSLEQTQGVHREHELELGKLA